MIPSSFVHHPSLLYPKVRPATVPSTKTPGMEPFLLPDAKRSALDPSKIRSKILSHIKSCLRKTDSFENFWKAFKKRGTSYWLFFCGVVDSSSFNEGLASGSLLEAEAVEPGKLAVGFLSGGALGLSCLDKSGWG